VDFITTHARVLDRHRLRLLLDPAGGPAAGQALAALRAYRNGDGGYGWGLEPDLRSAASQPAGALHALEVWAEVGAAGAVGAGAGGAEGAAGLCDWLAIISFQDGGLPFALPITDPAGSAPWWVGADPTVSSLQITAAMAASGHRVAAGDPGVAAHPWLRAATRYCLDAIGALGDRPPAHILSFSLGFLDAVAGTAPEAGALITRLAAWLPADGILPVAGGAAGEVLHPLDYSPEPGSAVRGLLPPAVVQHDLERLSGLQQPDGGWPIDFAVSSPAAGLEWRGYATVKALADLRRNGVLPG
jgi:hypothetical protein